MGKFPDKRKIYYDNDLVNASIEDRDKFWSDGNWNTEFFCNNCDEWLPHMCLENCGCDASGVRYKYYKAKVKSS